MAITNSIEYTNRIAGGVRKNILDKLNETNRTINDLKLRTHVGEKLDYFFGTIENTTFIPDTNIPITKCQSNSLELNSDNTITLYKNKTYTVEFCLNDVIGAWRIIYNVTDDKELQNYSRGDSQYQTNCSAIIETSKDIKIAFRVDRDTSMTANTISSYVKIQEIGREVLINEVEEVAKAKHIEDTPVGSILGVLSLTAPAHYLICDGTEYNIEDYPKLAQYFKDTLGSINYYGGDGVNTFAVPDFRGEFIRGYDETNIRDPLGSTRGIGKHEDATEIPFVYSNSKYIEMYKNSEGANIPKNYDISKNNNGNNISIIATEDSRYQGMYAYKTRPTNVNVLWCIKYEPTYFMNYSPMYGGFNKTILFEGEASAVGEYALNDTIEDYNMLLIMYYVTNDTYVKAIKQSMLVPLSEIKIGSTNDIRLLEDGSYLKQISFKDNSTFRIDFSNNDSIYIYKIIGIKANSNTIIKNEDIQIDNITYTEDEINSALNNITGGDSNE